MHVWKECQALKNRWQRARAVSDDAVLCLGKDVAMFSLTLIICSRLSSLQLRAFIHILRITFSFSTSRIRSPTHWLTRWYICISQSKSRYIHWRSFSYGTNRVRVFYSLSKCINSRRGLTSLRCLPWFLLSLLLLILFSSRFKEMWYVFPLFPNIRYFSLLAEAENSFYVIKSTTTRRLHFHWAV